MGAQDAMIRVAALTSGKDIPSARFRIRQYIPYLHGRGIQVADYCPPISQGARLPGPLGRIRERYLPPVMATKTAINLGGRIPGMIGSYRADLTWLERNLVPGLDDLACLLKRPLVLDIDDGIWLYNPFGEGMIRRLVRRADLVLAGNRFIADWCASHCRAVAIMPTGIDCARFRPRPEPKAPDAPFVVGWTGTSTNFPFLGRIEAALARFLKINPDARLLVVADRRPRLAGLPPGQFFFQPWRAETEHRVLHEMDVGIMPLDDSDISRAKCSFKMLQYLAAGLPVIVSPYGMNREILDLIPGGMGPASAVEWLDCLQAAKVEMAARRSRSAVSRDIVLQHFSSQKLADKISTLFRSVLAKGPPENSRAE